MKKMMIKCNRYMEWETWFLGFVIAATEKHRASGGINSHTKEYLKLFQAYNLSGGLWD